MTTYYRITDGALRDLTPELYDALAQPKRDTLRVYSVDPAPTPSATQFLTPGPVVVDATTARKTWTLVAKSAEQLATDAYVTERVADLSQIRTVYLALKNGTGTVAERAARMEKVLCRLLKDLYGGEPA